jgi:uncharacterized protein YerC
MPAPKAFIIFSHFLNLKKSEALADIEIAEKHLDEFATRWQAASLLHHKMPLQEIEHQTGLTKEDLQKLALEL